MEAKITGADANCSGKNQYVSYTNRGELYHTWGDVPYPAESGYDDYGRRTTMKTYRTGSGWTDSTWPG